MDPKQVERAAYLAAHRILTEDTAAPELACPGARRSYRIDKLAEIIIQTMGGYVEHAAEERLTERKRAESIRLTTAKAVA